MTTRDIEIVFEKKMTLADANCDICEGTGLVSVDSQSDDQMECLCISERRAEAAGEMLMDMLNGN